MMMAGVDEVPRYVCHKCVGDLVMKAEIQKVGRVHACHFCGRSRKSIRLRDLADRVDDVYRQIVVMAEETPVFDDDSDRVRWEADGENPKDIVRDMLECEEDLAEAVVGRLSKKHEWSVHRDGETDWYDDSSFVYEIHIPRDPQFRETWNDFCESVKHHRRFFNPSARVHLDEILGAALSGGWPGSESPVRMIGGPDDAEHRHVYRARPANGIESRRRIYSAPARELGAPPRSAASPGRMNAAGISVFYGAFDAQTCIAETRVPVGGGAVVGRFDILRPLRILDMRAFDRRAWGGSVFHPQFIRNHAHVAFLREFHAEIRRPVLPNTETLEYLPTQVMAEYLAAMVQPPIDGILYSSVQSEGVNIAIFPHACSVVPDEDPVSEDRVSVGYDEDGEEIVRIIPLPDGTEAADVDMGWGVDPLSDFAAPAPSLRLEGMSVMHVKAVSYTTTENRVSVRRTARNEDDGVPMF